MGVMRNLLWSAGYDCSESDLNFFEDKCYELLQTAPNAQITRTYQQLLRCEYCERNGEWLLPGRSP